MTSSESFERTNSLFNDERFGDCKVTCADGRDFFCSKWKLAEGSDFFYKLLSGNWKESSSSTIPLEETDSEPIEAMILYLHTGRYSYAGLPSHSMTLAQHVKLFVTADFYRVVPLKDTASEAFETIFPRHPVDDEWFDVVEQVYTTTFRSDNSSSNNASGGLTDIVIKTALSKMDDLCNFPEERWLRLCIDQPDILRDLFKKLRSNQHGNGGSGGGSSAGGRGGQVPQLGNIPPMPGGAGSSHSGGFGRPRLIRPAYGRGHVLGPHPPGGGPSTGDPAP